MRPSTFGMKDSKYYQNQGGFASLKSTPIGVSWINNDFPINSHIVDVKS